MENVIKSIYLASSFFCEEEVKTMRYVQKRLEESGYTVYAPFDFKVSDADNISNSEWAKEVYESDIKHLRECDCVVGILGGMCGDTGTAWELGYAVGIEKPVYVIVDSNVNSLMVVGGATGTLLLSVLDGNKPVYLSGYKGLYRGIYQS